MVDDKQSHRSLSHRLVVNHLVLLVLVFYLDFVLGNAIMMTTTIVVVIAFYRHLIIVVVTALVVLAVIAVMFFFLSVHKRRE